MFPPGQSDDPFLFHYNSYQEHSNIQQDQILQGQASLERNINSNKMGKGQQHKLLLAATAKVNYGSSDNNNNEKMILRKDIERQRRQHMSMLHASLRSLLPLQSIKGKRSMSDHINEALNYINYLNKNIQELGLKRDKLKNLSEFGAVGHGSSNWDNCLQNCVTIHPYSGGVEIVINSVHREENLKLSKVMEAVLEEGLDVIRCASTQTDEWFFHTIHAEVCFQEIPMECENIRWIIFLNTPEYGDTELTSRVYKFEATITRDGECHVIKPTKAAKNSS